MEHGGKTLARRDDLTARDASAGRLVGGVDNHEFCERHDGLWTVGPAHRERGGTSLGRRPELAVSGG